MHADKAAFEADVAFPAELEPSNLISPFQLFFVAVEVAGQHPPASRFQLISPSRDAVVDVDLQGIRRDECKWKQNEFWSK